MFDRLVVTEQSPGTMQGEVQPRVIGKLLQRLKKQVYELIPSDSFPDPFALINSAAAYVYLR